MVMDAPQALDACEDGFIPVRIDPDLQSMGLIQPNVLVDARMKKRIFTMN